MKKLLLATLCGALALTMAVPAMADHTLGGYYRVQFMSVKGLDSNNMNADGDTTNFVDQRLRAKWTNSINDYVTVVWYGEVDTFWGNGQYAGRNSGGGLDADSANVETKNAYAVIKIPDTSFVVKVGVQGFGDIFGDMYFDNDVAGISTTAKFGMTSVNLAWLKFKEGDTAVEDDTDMYALTVGLAPSDAVKVNLGAYYQYENTGAGSDSENTLLTIGATAAFAAGPVMLDFGLANQSSETGTVDGSALMGWVKAAMTFGDVKTFARVLYISNDDDANDNDRWTNLSVFEFYKDGLMIFGTDVRYNNGPGGRYAYNAAYDGYGLLGLTLGADMKIAGDYALHLGLFTGVTLDEAIDDAADSKEGTTLGTEINCQLSRNVGEKANVALRGAYAFLGDYYDAAAGDDPDDMYTVSVVLNIGY
jgi:hypothetical protein